MAQETFMKADGLSDRLREVPARAAGDAARARLGWRRPGDEQQLDAEWRELSRTPEVQAYLEAQQEVIEMCRQVVSRISAGIGVDFGGHVRSRRLLLREGTWKHDVMNDPEGRLPECVEELMTSLKVAPAVAAFIDAQRRFQRDAELTRLRAELQDAADAFQRVKPGERPQAMLADVRERQARVQAHPLVQEYVATKNSADAFLKEVNAIDQLHQSGLTSPDAGRPPVDAAEEHDMLAGTRVLLGVTGSIAAYQAADLIGLLKAQLADVRVIMTPAATRFITPLTLAVISGHRVTVDMFDDAGGRSSNTLPWARLRRPPVWWRPQRPTSSPRWRTVLPTTCSPQRC